MEPTDLADPILIAEADPIFGDLLEAYLSSRAYGTVRVRDGRRALEALTRERFHVLLVGLELAGLDGLEVAACAALLPAPPPIVLTTSDLGFVHATGVLGISMVITRPCRLGALVEAIERATGRRAPRPSVTRPAVDA